MEHISDRYSDCADNGKTLPAGCENLDNYCRDANIARLDFGLLILKRRNRLSIQKWRCSSEPCSRTADLVNTFEMFAYWIDTDQGDYLNWFRYLFHEQPDNSTHPLRLTVLKIINLPSLIPPISPNDCYDEDRAEEQGDRVREALNAIRLVLKGDQLPNLTSDPIPGVGAIAI